MYQRVLICLTVILLFTAAPSAGQPPVIVSVDIMPDRCPNRIELVERMNVLSPLTARATRTSICVAVAGSSALDARTIEPSTILLEGVPATSSSYSDVVAAWIPLDLPCGCFATEPDGRIDLVLKFDQAAILAALAPVNDGDRRTLTLTATTKTGEAMTGSDCVTVGMKVLSQRPTAVESVPPAPSINYPNPFNAATVISYRLDGNTHVSLEVYDVLGRRVRTLVDGFQGEGTHQQEWNGTNASGIPVASGMYFYRLIRGEVTETRKMVVLR